MFRIFFVLFVIDKVSCSFSDVGKWDLQLSGEDCSFSLAKSLFKNSRLIIAMHCDAQVPLNITYKWATKPCSPEYLHFFEQQVVTCDSRLRFLDDANTSTNQVVNVQETRTCHSNSTLIFDGGKSGNIEMQTSIESESKLPPLLVVEKEGVYILTMEVESNKKFNAVVRIEIVSPWGYLSAAIWPLLPFFGVMCAAYTVLSAGWLCVCALQWRDLLRIQYWIGGVALLGMLETATYYGLYSSINRSGYFNVDAFMFAEVISAAKRALARMLVIIVSLGFGIVKPRLGPALQRVGGAGALWFVLDVINAWLRLHHNQLGSNRDLLLSEMPLSLMDSAICWWVFVSLAHTMRTLQLRRNAVKLSLYRHFTNTLIFAVISSVIFMLYCIKSFRVQDCISDWKEVWVDEAFWHILFICVLTVIMILWRPTNNNQRYAFTPLLDNAEDDDDEEEQFVNDAYGVKMRGSSINADPDTRDSLPEPNTNSLDSDLRWVEENIPTSTLPLLDSDEEIINTKFEVSKMQ